MLAAFAESAQRSADACALRQKDSRSDVGHKWTVQVAARNFVDNIADVKNPDDVIDVSLVHRNLGVRCFLLQFQKLAHRGGGWDREHLCAWDHHLAHIHLPKLKYSIQH